MKIRHVVTKGLICAAMLMTRHAIAGDSCPAITDSEKTRLLDYVSTKYKLSSAKTLKLAEVSSIEDTCYRRLRFRSDDPKRPFQMDLTASPDLRFLSRELLDSQLDPAAEEAQKQHARIEALTRGEFAALGKKSAPVTLTIFADFQCPFCARASDLLMKEILPSEGDNVRLIFRHFPLLMHPWAQPAAEIAFCAHEQGDQYFWSFHNYLFEHQREISADNLPSKVEALGSTLRGFDAAQLQACLRSGKAASKVEMDVKLGTELGVHATPSVFINGQMVIGVQAEQIRTYVREITADRTRN